MAHGIRDVDEVLPELTGYVFIAWIFRSQLECDGQQVERIHGHPTGAVRLFDVAASRQWCAAIEYSDIVQTQEPALEDVDALGVLAIYPPGEVQHQFVKDPLQESAIALAFALLVDLVYPPGCPCVNRRVDIAERPFIGGNLAIGMHVPLAQHERKLLFGEVGIDKRQW